jgi:hypothetical protein
MYISQRGSASIEFVIVAVAVFLPLLALAVTVSSIQTSQFAVAVVARQGVRAFALSPSEMVGQRRIAAINQLVRDDFGVDSQVSWAINCSTRPCHSRGGLVRVTVNAAVPIAMIPVLPGLTLPPGVRISSTATHIVPLVPLP